MSFTVINSILFTSTSLCYSSLSPLLWVPTETLSRALKSCQSVLEGGSQPVSNRSYFQSAVQITVRVLDSILYLTSKDLNTKILDVFGLVCCQNKS